MPAHDLAPPLERLARAEPHRVVLAAGDLLVVRVAAPVHVPQDLVAHPQHDLTLGQHDPEDARDVGHERRDVRRVPVQGVGHDQVLAVPEDPRDERTAPVLVGHVADRDEAALRDDDRAVGPHEAAQPPRARQGDADGDALVAAVRGQVREDAFRAPHLGLALVLRLGDEPDGERGPEELRGGADLEGRLVRPRVVVARDETPQPAVAQERDRHRRPHAHVAQVLEVDRRDAAQRRVREVERRTRRGEQRRDDRLGRVVHVRDEPDPVLLVQRARLRRDVRRRVVQPEERVEVVPARLGDDLAVVGRVEAVDHHAVEARELAHVPGRVVVQLVERRGALEVAQRLPDGEVGVGERQRARARRGLDLDDEHRLGPRALLRQRGPVEHGVDVERPVVPAVEVQGDGVARREVAPVRRVREQVARGLLAEHVGERPARELLRGDAEVPFHVRRRLEQHAVRLADHQQDPARLDHAGDVDGLAGAVVEVHRLAGREELRLVDRPGHDPPSGHHVPRTVAVLRSADHLGSRIRRRVPQATAPRRPFVRRVRGGRRASPVSDATELRGSVVRRTSGSPDRPPGPRRPEGDP